MCLFRNSIYSEISIRNIDNTVNDVFMRTNNFMLIFFKFSPWYFVSITPIYECSNVLRTIILLIVSISHGELTKERAHVLSFQQFTCIA